MGDQSQGRYLDTEQHKQNKRTETSTTQVGFEPTIPVFEREKTVLALERAVTVTGRPGASRENVNTACYTGISQTVEGAV
jgi:hypothetical protein